tara:strand:- start:22711 stop:22899 length:189 start_codon:yes stop_codon:yes gene_type:complete
MIDDKAWELLTKKLDDLTEDVKDIRSDQKEQMKILSGLKVKVGAMGALFGMIGAYIKSKIHL